MKKLVVSIIITLAGSAAFAESCQFKCAAEQLQCVRSTSRESQQRLCQAAHFLCLRNCDAFPGNSNGGLRLNYYEPNEIEQILNQYDAQYE